MKLKHLFFNAVAVMAFAACSSEAEEIKPAEKNSTATLQLEMTGQYGSGNTDQTRALTFDGGDYPIFTHQEGTTNWQTHCFIRNEAGTAQFYALVDWNATTNDDGSISLHIKNSTLTLQNSAGSDVTATATLPKAGERWYIAGIAGGGVLDDTKSNVSFAYNQALDAKLTANQARVPLAFGWTRFTIPSNTERAPRIVVQFQPQGTLLGVYVNNRTNRGKAVVTSQLKVRTNALSQSGVFDYALTATRAEYASAPKWTFANEQATTETIVRDINVPQDAGANCYIWAMPRTTAPTEGFSTKTYVGRYKTFAEGTTDELPVKTEAFAAAKSYHTGLDIDRPRMPLEYWTERNVNQDGTGFVTSDANNDAQMGYFSHSDATARFANITIDGQSYSLPAAYTARSLFHFNTALHLDTYSSLPATALNQEEWGVSVGGLRHGTLQADYYITSFTEFYGIRLKGGNNDMTVAYRYQILGSGTETYLKVTNRYLGPSDLTINDIANSSYWESNTADDIVRVFPYAGSKLSPNTETISQIGRVCALAVNVPLTTTIPMLLSIHGLSNESIVQYRHQYTLNASSIIDRRNTVRLLLND